MRPLCNLIFAHISKAATLTTTTTTMTRTTTTTTKIEKNTTLDAQQQQQQQQQQQPTPPTLHSRVIRSEHIEVEAIFGVIRFELGLEFSDEGAVVDLNARVAIA